MKNQPKRIPIAAAKRYGQDHGQHVVVCMSHGADGKTHVVTWGSTKEHCKWAADGGERLMNAIKGGTLASLDGADRVWRVTPDEDQPGETWDAAYERLAKRNRAHNTFMVAICDDHLDNPGPAPGCYFCELDELRERLVQESEGGAGRRDARLWERRCGMLEDHVRELGGDPFRGVE